MTLNQTDRYIRVCMNAWLLCEACIYAEKEKLFPKQTLVEACHACSESCLAVVSIFISNPIAVQKQVFECFLQCRQCYNECILSGEGDIEYCGEVCDNCAEIMKELIYFHLN